MTKDEAEKKAKQLTQILSKEARQRNIKYFAAEPTGGGWDAYIIVPHPHEEWAHEQGLIE